jgi:hypothetical protein
MPRMMQSRRPVRARSGEGRVRAEGEVRGGATIRALAEETGRSYGGVHRLLVDAGVVFRSRGGAVRQGPAS